MMCLPCTSGGWCSPRAIIGKLGRSERYHFDHHERMGRRWHRRACGSCRLEREQLVHAEEERVEMNEDE